MRWVSWDQKPAWFNNTALDGAYSLRGYGPQVKEVAAHPKQRFTICTCVASAVEAGDGKPPPVGVLFKAAPGGRVWRDLKEDEDIPDWMHVQTQEKGSYRASDTVELLEKTLTPAVNDYDAHVVGLDCPQRPGRARCDRVARTCVAATRWRHCSR